MTDTQIPVGSRQEPDTLTRAANDASEALGMSVAVREDGASRPTRLVFLIEVYAPMDSDCQEPIEYKRTIGIEPVLAYLEGLETGARTMRKRHAEAREVLAVFADCAPTDEPAGKQLVARACAALANLED